MPLRAAKPWIAAVAAASSLVALPAREARAEDCARAQTQMALDICAKQELEVADRALNATYDKVLDRLRGGPSRNLLVAAEKQWIAFRDSECAFAASGTTGGSAYPMVLSGCLTEMTKNRTRALAHFLACQEGDLSCPVPPK